MNFIIKLIFDLIDLDVLDFFRLRFDDRNRGHQYKLFRPGSRSEQDIIIIRHYFYSHRAARVWNDLPADSTNFSTLNSFKRTVAI